MAGINFQKKARLLLKQPWITERSVGLGGLDKYVFVVDGKTNKPETKKAIEAVYGVKVKDVNIINVKGKPKRLGRSMGRTSKFKKAIVTLKKGHKIDIAPA